MTGEYRVFLIVILALLIIITFFVLDARMRVIDDKIDRIIRLVKTSIVIRLDNNDELVDGT